MAKQRPKGWWYPYIFVGGFLVVLGVNLTLLFFATSTFNGLETRHAWTEGNHYNAEIAAEEAQKKLGWDVVFESGTTEAAPAGDAGVPAHLDVVVHDRDGNPVDGLTVQAEVRRPTQEGHDLSVQLDAVGPGTYRKVVDLPLAGQWDIRLVASRGQDSYRLRKRIFLR